MTIAPQPETDNFNILKLVGQILSTSRTLSKMGENEMSSNLLRMALDLSEKVDSDNGFCKKMAFLFLNTNNTDLLIKLSEKEDVYFALAGLELLFKEGKKEEAEKILQHLINNIKIEFESVDIFLRLSEYIFYLKSEEECLSILEACLKIAENLNRVKQAEIRIEVCRVLLNIGKRDMFEEVIEKAIDSTMKISDPYCRANFLLEILKTLKIARDDERINYVFKELSEVINKISCP